MNDAHTVLALDADSESLVQLMRILMPAGYRLVSAGSGTPAPSAASVDPPDLILLDMGMG